MPPQTPKPIDDSNITVTTATRSEADVRASLEPAPVEKPVVDEAAATLAAAKVLDDEADSPKTDAEISEAARTLRSSKLTTRKARISRDTELYADTIRSLGGTPVAIETREYKAPSEEIDHLTGYRHKLHDQMNRLLKGRKPAIPAAPAKPAPAVAEKPAAGDDASTIAAAAASKFTFPTFEQYQEKHAEASWEEYLDARSDARRDFTQARERETAAASEQEASYVAALEQSQQHQADWVATHPDHVEKLKKIDLSPFGVVVEDGQIVDAPPQFATLQRLILNAGQAGPAINEYIADNPAELARLMTARTPAAQLEAFVEVKLAAKTAAAAAPAAPVAVAKPAAAEPLKPKPGAPAPLGAMPAGAPHTKSASQVSADSEDADEYIAKRRQQRGAAA